MKDYYKILGVAPDCTAGEIKKAYRALALQHHPDRNSGDKASEERFKAIAESYNTLIDTSRRDAYDYAKDNARFSRNAAARGEVTPVAVLLLVTKIKNKVFNAGGYINQYALFRVIDDILSDKNLNVLINTNDSYTNSLIIDEILISAVFLGDSHKEAVYEKLVKLADGDPRCLEKIAVLQKKSEEYNYQPEESSAKPFEGKTVFFFILLLLFLIAVVVM